ncbi:MAG: hypothetical protein R3248_01670 [Candidatus Promineifilaceae bacterium]|nr:hypothetical protein [Candidatus Promineifilaceae bacterium]
MATTTVLHTAIIQTGRLQEMADFYRHGLALGDPMEQTDHATRKPWGARLAVLFDPDGNVFGLTGRDETPE